MNHIQGPGIFLAQFLGDESPFDGINALAGWASDLGYVGVQVPTWDARAIDLNAAASSRDYCDEYKGRLADAGSTVIELASYLQGQVMAMHPAYERLFQPFYPQGLNDQQRIAWATEQLEKTIRASVRLGTTNISVLSGGLAWPYMYPWPQRSEGLIDEAFKELARRWHPLLELAHEHGITFGFELHPGSDLYDGATYLRFLDVTEHHPAACLTYDPSHFLLQQLDYIDFIERFADRIKAFHVKDAEYRPDGLTGVYGGYESWGRRAGRFRSPGDGQIDFKHIFSRLTAHGYRGWAILEWECYLKSPEQGAREGAAFIRNQIIETTSRTFDDFAKSDTDRRLNRELLGLEQSDVNMNA